MSTLWPVLGAVACPLGMFAIGGGAWAAGKLIRGQHPSRLGRAAGMLACNPLAGLSSLRAKKHAAVDGGELAS